MTETGNILIVVTSVGQFEKVGLRTGLWLGEFTHFWDVAEEAGFAMDVASPLGCVTPIDPESLIVSEVGMTLGLRGGIAKHYEDRAFMDHIDRAKKLAEIDAAEYDAIYLTGGHGVMFDFPHSAPLADLIGAFWRDGKIVSAVCHGPAGLLNVKVENQYLVASRNVTGFSWMEEIAAKRDHAAPFNLEEQLQLHGASYTKALAPFMAHVVEDGPLITGQNPSSARGVAKAVVAKLLEKRRAAAA